MVAQGDRQPVLPLGRDRPLDRDGPRRAARARPDALRARCPSSSPTPASSRPRAATSCGSTCPTGTDVAALFDAAAARGVQFVKGTDFVLEGGESSLRLAYSGVTPAEIEEGVKRLAEAYAEVGAPASMRPEELRALGDLAGDAAAGIASQAREVHESIAARVFGALGPTAAPVRDDPRPGRRRRLRGGVRVHRRARPGRRGVRRSDAAPMTAVADRGTRAGGWPSARSTAAWGDRCTATAARWRRRWRCASAGATWRSIPAAGAALPAGHAAAGGVRPRPVRDRRRLAAARRPDVPYGDRLRIGARATRRSIIRYNSGLHISHNGRRLRRCSTR